MQDPWKDPVARPKPLYTTQRYPGLKVKTWMHVRFIMLSIVVLIIGVASILYIIDTDTCQDMECFIEKAHTCQRAYFEMEEDGITYYFSTEGCNFNKKITGLPDDEPELVKSMLLQKSLTCKYSPGEFDRRWMTTLLSGLENCNGELKIALYEIAIAQYQIELETYEI